MLTELGGTAKRRDRQAARRRGRRAVGPGVRRRPGAGRGRPPSRPPGRGRRGEWRLFAPAHHPLATALHTALRRAELGDGVLLCLPREVGEDRRLMMLRAARAALADRRAGAVRRRWATAAAAPGWPRPCTWRRRTCRPRSSPCRCRRTCPRPAPAARCRGSSPTSPATEGFSEVVYDAAGERRVPVLRPLPVVPRAARVPIGAADVLLVTGGGKGITAECALALAVETGAKVGLLGRSDPAADAGAGGEPGPAGGGRAWSSTTRAPTSPRADEVKAAVEEVRGALGPVTAVLHGAGRNEPAALAEPGRGVVPQDPGSQGRRAGGRAGGRGPGGAAAAGHVRQHHRPRGPARPGRLRRRQRLDDRPDPPACRSSSPTASAWRWSGRSGPARAWASGSASWSP